MDQNADKLLRYLIDFDGLLDAVYARQVFAGEFTIEFFEDYQPSRNEFQQTVQSMIFEFAKGYFEEYGSPPTEDSLMHELITRSDLHSVRKQEITKALRMIRQFSVNPNEFQYVRDRVRELYLISKAVQVMQNGMETIKIDPIRGVEAVQRNLADVLARAVVSENVRDQTLNLGNFSRYLLAELDNHGELMHGSVKYPYPNFNTALGGMHPGELIVIAGPSNAGKSFIGRDIAYHVGLTLKEPVVCADREMIHDQQGVRFLAYLTQVPQKKIKQSKLQTPAERELMYQALSIYADVENPDESSILFIPPMRCVNSHMIRREVEAKWGNKKPRLIIADYLNEFEPTRKAEGWEAMKRVCSDLKQLALYFECPVLTMAQTNDKGAIQYKAIRHICDTLLIIAEDPDCPYIPPEGEGNYIGTPGRVNVWVDKARNDAKHVMLALEVEFATASIRQATHLATHKTSQAVLERDNDVASTPYDSDPDLEE
jgi:replicative DNA helicase